MYDVIVIGCGITGAAAALELSKYQLKVAVLEKENDVAQGATKANSAILHAGYDPKPGTLMAKLNVRGVELAAQLCEKLDVPYNRNGAMVLGFSEEDKATLQDLYDERVPLYEKYADITVDIINGNSVRQSLQNLLKKL